MKVSKRFGSQKTDLLFSVIRLDARIIVRWTKMEMRFEIKRGKKKKKKKRKSNLVSLFGTIFYANVTRNETKSSLNQRLRIEGGDKENTAQATSHTGYGERFHVLPSRTPRIPRVRCLVVQ